MNEQRLVEIEECYPLTHDVVAELIAEVRKNIELKELLREVKNKVQGALDDAHRITPASVSHHIPWLKSKLDGVMRDVARFETKS
jgi:hypothetical protein